MPSAPKPTCPIYNDANVQAPPLTRQLDVPVPGQRDETIAAGSNNKLSWAGVFSLDHSQGVDLPQSLDNGAVSMTRDSRFLQAYLKNILANSVAGRTSMRIATPKQVLPIVAEHRVEWVQEILARGTGGGPELGDDVSDVFVTAGAIYAMLRMIPRRKDAVAAIYQLQWHGYYDDFPDLML